MAVALRRAYVAAGLVVVAMQGFLQLHQLQHNPTAAPAYQAAPTKGEAQDFCPLCFSANAIQPLLSIALGAVSVLAWLAAVVETKNDSALARFLPGYLSRAPPFFSSRFSS